jgi:hypothetical protein
MKSIALQNAEELGGSRSVLSRQRRDHVRLHQLLEELQSCDPYKSGPLLICLYRLVFPHAFAEEAVLWPVIRRLLPDGNALTLQVEREHQRINELVTRLEATPPGSEEWRAVLDGVIPLLLQDIRDEEDALLPRLQQVLSPRQLRLLGAQWELVRAIAPTRCHPIVSRRPPGNVLSALPLSLIDRVRDRVDSSRYRRRSAPFQDWLSAGLTSAAHAVEHLPGMKSGEEPATHIRSTSHPFWRPAAIGGVLLVGTILMRRRARACR